TPIVQVDSASRTGGALREDGYLVILAPTDMMYRDVPAHVQGRVDRFAISDDHVGVVLDDGTVHVWGNGAAVDRETGAFSTWADSDAQPALFPPDHIQGRAIDIGAGRGHFTVLLDDGTIYSWGDNSLGQTNLPRNNNDFVEIFIGYHFNFALRADGSTESWGFSGFIFGTDGFGRDIFDRLWTAGRYAFFIGIVAVIIQLFIGIVLGSISGYFGGKVDMVLMRFAEAVSSLPFFPIALIMRMRLGTDVSELQGLFIMMFVLGILTWPMTMRLVRGQVLQARDAEYVTAAKALGAKEGKIIFKHIMPNILSIIIVQAALGLAGAMMIESTLSFLGFGISEPTPTWGNMISGSVNSTILRDEWWRWVFPSTALVIVTMSINLIGDGLREAFDPRTRGR
ncbi:MAG: ABC transporter permease subunit, partial [Defluviitaleaceae bacterium]|nr:ABC transporter permease subunit [Defluviitaleaceae bacterium]